MRIWVVLIIILFSNPALGEESLRITSYALKADNNIIVAAQKLKHTSDFKTGLFLINSKTKSITKIKLNPLGYMREISHIIPVKNQIYLISQLSIGGGDSPIMEKLSPDGSLEKLHSFDECASVKRVSLKRDYITLYSDENVREKILRMRPSNWHSRAYC